MTAMTVRLEGGEWEVAVAVPLTEQKGPRRREALVRAGGGER